MKKETVFDLKNEQFVLWIRQVVVIRFNPELKF